jgi:hypothetical protein
VMCGKMNNFGQTIQPVGNALAHTSSRETRAEVAPVV